MTLGLWTELVFPCCPGNFCQLFSCERQRIEEIEVLCLLKCSSLGKFTSFRIFWNSMMIILPSQNSWYTTTENSNKLFYPGLVRDLQYNHVPQRVQPFRNFVWDADIFAHYKKPFIYVHKSRLLIRYLFQLISKIFRILCGRFLWD